MGDPKTPSTYWPQLDGLRAIAFLAVFFFHLGPPPGVQGTIASWLARVVTWGWAGVDLFFVLSGFLVTSLLLQERQRHGNISFRLFFARRALRIWPLYYLALIIGFLLLPSVALFGPGLGSPEWQQVMQKYALPFATFLGNFSLLNSQAPPKLPFTMTALWSISIEEQFYIAWCLTLCRLNQPRTIGRLLVLAGIGSLAFRLWIRTRSDDIAAYYNNTFSHLDPIVAGALLGLLHSQSRLPKVAYPLLTSIGAWALLIFCLPSLFLNGPTAPWVFSLVAGASALSLLAALTDPRAARLLSRPWLVSYGRITFGLYVFHLLGLNLANWLLWKWNPFATPLQFWVARLLLGLPITTMLAVVSWNTLEKPFNNLRHRLSRVNQQIQG